MKRTKKVTGGRVGEDAVGGGKRAATGRGRGSGAGGAGVAVVCEGGDAVAAVRDATQEARKLGVIHTHVRQHKYQQALG